MLDYPSVVAGRKEWIVIIAINKWSAVRIMRWVRAHDESSLGTTADGCLALTSRRVDLVPPSPNPAKRWSARALNLERFESAATFSPDDPLCVATPNPSARLRMRATKNTVYAHGLPAGAFVDLGGGVSVSSPELMFVEASAYMGIIEHVMLGYELCGSYALDASDPLNGPTAFWVPPLTTVEKIGAFIDECDNVRGTDVARERLAYVANNAWAPTEALVSALICVPIWGYGFGIGSVTLNKRIDPSEFAAKAFAKAFRRPDIIINGTGVGINYDGEGHLDLDSVARAAVDAYRLPEIGLMQETLSRVKDSVRDKVVDDKRRDRELASQGYVVIPVTKEDLSAQGGFESLIHLVLDAIENHAGIDMSQQRGSLVNPGMQRKRQNVVWSLLPGERGKRISRELEEEREARWRKWGLR